MKIKIEDVGYLEVPDNTSPEQIKYAVQRIAFQHREGGKVTPVSPPVAPKTPQKQSKAKDVMEGIGSIGGQLVTAPVLMSAGIMAGLMKLALTGKSIEATKAQQTVMENMNKKLGYAPKSELGQKIANVPAQIFEFVGSTGDKLQEKIVGKKMVEKIKEMKADKVMPYLDSVVNQLAPMAAAKIKPPLPTKSSRIQLSTSPKYTPKVKSQKTKDRVVKSVGPSLDAEKMAILDAFEPGKRKMPEIRKGARPNEYEHVIGLDIDSVLNRGTGKLEPDLVANFNKVLDADPKARIVVGSTWRLGHTVESMEQLLAESGVRKGRVIGMTGDLGDVARGAEYAEWLKTHGKKVKKVLILDDRTDLQPFSKRQIVTKEGVGFSPEFADAAIRMLTVDKQKPWQWEANFGEMGLIKPESPKPVAVKVGKATPATLGRKPVMSPGPGAKAINIRQEAPSITQLRNSLADVPRTPASQRMTIARNILGAKQTFTSKVEAAGASLKAGGAGLWDAYSRPPIAADFKGALGDYLLARARFQSEGYAYAKEIKAAIPDKITREGMTNWIEAEGSVELLRQRLAQTKDPLLRQGYESALKLSPEQKLHAQNMRNYLDDMLEQGQQAGILEEGVENYISHIWGGTSKGRKLISEMNSGLLGVNPALLKKRILESYFEGEQLGLIPKNKDAGYLITGYDSSFKEMLAARTFVKSLTELKGKDGRPLAVVSGGGRTLPPDAKVPEGYLIRPKTKPEDAFDYRRVDHPSLRKWKWVDKDPNGAPIFVQGDMLLHPEIMANFAERFAGKGYYSMENLFGTSAISKNPLGRLALRGLGEFKRTLLSLSGFHQVQVGIHAVFHNVSPVKAPPINLYDPVTAKGVRNGLMVTDHSALIEFSEGVGGHSGLVGRIPGLGPMMQRYQEYLFQDYIPRLKVSMFKEAYERNLKRYPKLTSDQVAEITGHQANAAFGELNYKWLGRNKTFQDSLRVLFLAPDFLEARTKFVAQALTPHGKEQLAALIRGSAELYIGARLMNMLLNDGDAKMDKPFGVVYGKKEYALRTVPGDIAHLFHDPRGFVYWRINPGITRPMVEWATGKDARGRERTAGLEIFDFIKSGIPIPIQGFMKDPSDTLAESVLTSALQSLGINRYVNRSEAEKVAMEASMQNLPKSAETFETRKKAKLMKKLRDAVEDTPQGVPPEIFESLQKGEITERQAVNLIKDRDKPPLVRSFERMRIQTQLKDIEKVFEKATPEERAMLEPLMRKKVINWFSNPNTSKADRDKHRDRLLKYLK